MLLIYLASISLFQCFPSIIKKMEKAQRCHRLFPGLTVSQHIPLCSICPLQSILHLNFQDLSLICYSSVWNSYEAPNYLQDSNLLNAEYEGNSSLPVPCFMPQEHPGACQSVQFSRSVVSDSLWPHESQPPGLPVYHQLPGFTQTHAHWVGDAIRPSHPLLSPSPPAPNLSQHQGLFQWVNSSHEVAKVLEFQLQHQSFQWTLRTDLL